MSQRLALADRVAMAGRIDSSTWRRTGAVVDVDLTARDASGVRPPSWLADLGSADVEATVPRARTSGRRASRDREATRRATRRSKARRSGRRSAPRPLRGTVLVFRVEAGELRQVDRARIAQARDDFLREVVLDLLGPELVNEAAQELVIRLVAFALDFDRREDVAVALGDREMQPQLVGDELLELLANAP
jgi:hypothetical protein